jgi:hypothetical protein
MMCPPGIAFVLFLCARLRPNGTKIPSEHLFCLGRRPRHNLPRPSRCHATAANATAANDSFCKTALIQIALCVTGGLFLRFNVIGFFANICYVAAGHPSSRLLSLSARFFRPLSASFTSKIRSTPRSDCKSRPASSWPQNLPKQVPQHNVCLALFVDHFILREVLRRGNSVFTKFILAPKHLDALLRATSAPLDQVNDVDMGVSDGLNPTSVSEFRQRVGRKSRNYVQPHTHRSSPGPAGSRWPDTAYATH